MTAVAAPPGLAPALRAALDTVVVDPSGTVAELPGKTIEADSPTELRGRLSAALYDALHTGRAADAGDIPFRLRDPELEVAFARSVPHRTTRRQVTICDTEGLDVAGADPSQVLVLCDGVRVWVSARDLRGAPKRTPGSQVALAVPAMRPAVSPGFFFVSGSRPQQTGRHLLRLYLHLEDPEAASPAWAAALAHLEASGVGYGAKVLSARVLYPRRDALVIYLPEAHREVPAQLAGLLGALPGLRDETSVFTRRIAPGMATAWEPADDRPQMRGLSFGQHRAAVLARALVASAIEGTPREQAVSAALAEASVDPQDTSRNQDSPTL